MKILAVIPARGGSKGIPGKNIRHLGGIPLLAWSLDAARSADSIEEIIISTEDTEIAAVAASLGAEPLFLRPADLAADHTPTLPVLQHILERFADSGRNFDAICLLQPTSPFRPPGFVEAAIQKFLNSGADSLISVRKVPDEFNPHWIFEEGESGFLRLATGEDSIIPRRQELPPAYQRDGSVYLTKAEVIMEQNSLYGKKITWLENTSAIHVNLDLPSDWDEAERLLEKWNYGRMA